MSLSNDSHQLLVSGPVTDYKSTFLWLTIHLDTYRFSLSKTSTVD